MQVLYEVAKFKIKSWTLRVESLKETVGWRILQDNIECQTLNPKRRKLNPKIEWQTHFKRPYNKPKTPNYREQNAKPKC